MKPNFKRALRQRMNHLKQETSMAWNRLVAHWTGEDLFWEYESPVTGEMSDGQYTTATEAALAAGDEYQTYLDEWEDDGESFPPSENYETVLVQSWASDVDRVTRRFKESDCADADTSGNDEHRLGKAELGLR